MSENEIERNYQPEELTDIIQRVLDGELVAHINDGFYVGRDSRDGVILSKKAALKILAFLQVVKG